MLRCKVCGKDIDLQPLSEDVQRLVDQVIDVCSLECANQFIERQIFVSLLNEKMMDHYFINEKPEEC